MNRNWHKGFFSGLIAESWRRVGAVSPTAAEAEFLERELALKPGDRVLDVPCGAGRIATVLAAKGYRMEGVDLSAEFLADAQAASSEVEWHQRDMRELAGLGPFDAVFSFGNSFGYFDDAGNSAFLRAVAGVLKAGGRFALHSGIVAESIFTQPLGKRWYSFGDLLFLHDSAFDPAAGYLTSDYILMQGSTTERKQAHYRVFMYRELVGWLADAGLRVRSAYGTLAGEPFRLGSQSIWLVAERE